MNYKFSLFLGFFGLYILILLLLPIYIEAIQWPLRWLLVNTLEFPLNCLYLWPCPSLLFARLLMCGPEYKHCLLITVILSIAGFLVLNHSQIVVLPCSLLTIKNLNQYMSGFCARCTGHPVYRFLSSIQDAHSM